MSVEGVAGHGFFWGGIEGLDSLNTCIDGSTQSGRALLGERGQLGEGGGAPQEATMVLEAQTYPSQPRLLQAGLGHGCPLHPLPGLQGDSW